MAQAFRSPESRRRKLARATVLVVALLACPPGSHASDDATPSEAPGVLYSSAPPSEVAYPVWVAASHARGSDGSLDPTKFEPGKLSHLQEFVDAAPKQLAPVLPTAPVRVLQAEDCVLVSAKLPWSNLGEINTLTDLAARAHTVVSGEIVAVTPGFVFGIPASLLAVAVERFGSVVTRTQSPTLIYIAYPQGLFAIDGVAFCGQHETSAVPLEVGSRVVFLSVHEAADARDLMFVGSTRTMVVEAPDGSIVVGEHLMRDGKTEAVTSLDALLRIVEEAREGAP